MPSWEIKSEKVYLFYYYYILPVSMSFQKYFLDTQVLP